MGRAALGQPLECHRAPKHPAVKGKASPHSAFPNSIWLPDPLFTLQVLPAQASREHTLRNTALDSDPDGTLVSALHMFSFITGSIFSSDPKARSVQARLLNASAPQPSWSHRTLNVPPPCSA